MSKRRYDPEASREAILDAAETLFAARGFGEVSTGAIAAAAGVSQSQIHYHFDTKRKLWEQVFQRRFSAYFARQKEMLDMAGLDDKERVARSIPVYFAFFLANPQFVKLLGRAQLDGIQVAQDSLSIKLMRESSDAIARAQKSGEIRADVRPAFVLTGFLSLVAHWFQCRDQVVLEAGLPGSPENYDSEYLDFIIKVFVRGITP